MLQSMRPPPVVLIVHDDHQGGAYVRHLTAAGLRVDATVVIDDGEAALAAALRIAPDVIVLDLTSHSRTLERLKADERTRHIPVIALTDFSRSV